MLNIPTFPTTSTDDATFALYHMHCSDHRDCPWCGAKWVDDPAPQTSRSQQHTDDCNYAKWLNDEPLTELDDAALDSTDRRFDRKKGGE